MVPGVWLCPVNPEVMPFEAGSPRRVFPAEWYINYGTGEPSMTRLDPTQPEARAHMRKVLQTLYDQGYRLSLIHISTGTDDLGPPAVGIGHPFNSAGNLIVETGPATTGIELVRRTVQRRTAPAAMIRPRFMVVFVFTGKRALRPLVQDYPLLFRGQWFHNLRIYGTQRSQNE